MAVGDTNNDVSHDAIWGRVMAKRKECETAVLAVLERVGYGYQKECDNSKEGGGEKKGHVRVEEGGESDWSAVEEGNVGIG
jgi:hypothetical protein